MSTFESSAIEVDDTTTISKEPVTLEIAEECVVENVFFFGKICTDVIGLTVDHPPALRKLSPVLLKKQPSQNRKRP